MGGEEMHAATRPYFEGHEVREGRWRERETTGEAIREKLAGQAEGPSDRERAERVRAALEERFGGPSRRVELVDIFREDSTAVFWIETPEGADPPGAEFLMSRFEESAGRVTVEEPVRVVRRTVFEEVPAGNVAGDPIHRRAAEILDGLAHGDRMAVVDYTVRELKRVGACGRR